MSRSRPVLLYCRSCDVAWDSKVGRACWVCGLRITADPRQLVLTGQYAMTTTGQELEDELAKKPRDWGGDPTGWRLAPEESALKLLARRFMSPRVLPAPDEEAAAGQ